MEIVTSPEQEAAFIENFTRTGSAVSACVAARLINPRYAIEDVAAEVMSWPQIKLAVTAVQTTLDKGENVTRESIQRDMQLVFTKALGVNKFAEAINAKRTQAQLAGFMDVKVEVNHTLQVGDMTTEQLKQIVARALLKDKSEVAPKRPGDDAKIIDLMPLSIPAPGIGGVE